MGLCASVPMTEADRAALAKERQSTRAIESELQRTMQEERVVLKLLLLGTGESGKSTLFKQLTQLYGKGFTEEMRIPYASIVHTNCILAMKVLVRQSELFPESKHARISDSLLGSKNFINELKADMDLTPEIARHFKLLWADPGVRNTFELRSQFQLSDSCRYFFDKVEELARPGYVPSYQDILQCRARTTGIVETSFSIDGTPFRILDVGGQRNERKKWIHCFEGVTAVIFVAAINEYDQVLYEDGSTNRVVEALTLFEEMCNARWFRSTGMILFLNKRDLFQEKIKKVDMKPYFPDYEGGCNYDNAVDFLIRLFVSRNEYPSRRQVYVHITCATDTDNIRFTFNAVKDIIIRDRLKECGLILLHDA